MSKYTTELRFICENAAGLTESEGYNNINTILDRAKPYIFDFDFPIFDESYRNVLENKILKHFYTREIGVETVGLWKLRLDAKMNEIMPYYNQLYNSALLEFNPLYDVDLTTDHQKVDNGTHNDNENLNETIEKSGEEHIVGSVDSTGTSVVNDTTIHDKWDMYSDTPQGGLNGVRDEEYLTNARHTTDTTAGSTNTTNSNSSGTESRDNANSEDVSRVNINTKSGSIKNIQDYVEHVKGKTAGASYSKMLTEFRETFLNIDMMIIDELNELFMLIW